MLEPEAPAGIEPRKAREYFDRNPFRLSEWPDPAGNYLVTFEVRLNPEQRYECIVGPQGNAYLVKYNDEQRRKLGNDAKHRRCDDPHDGEPQILRCNGLTQDWDGNNPELHFIELGDIVQGVEG